LPEIIQIDTQQKSYQIFLGVDLKNKLITLLEKTPGRRVFIVYDTHLESTCKTLSELPQVIGSFEVGSGENSKNIDTFYHLHTQLMKVQFKRTDYLVALGGGVVGDLTGFVAATYQRGCGFIQVPTTVLAQVDSSVGGKTAINHDLGKNMIGAFYQPDAVIADFQLLKSLPARQMINGFSEIIKAAILGDIKLFEALERVDDLSSCDMLPIISRSVKVKKAFVEADENDLGIRNQLNLGHTFGHAIETIHRYEDILHGEAVAIGMVIASNFAYDNKMLCAKDKARIHQLIQQIGLPTELPIRCNPKNMIEAMTLDKKNLNNGVTFVVPRKIGQCEIIKDFSADTLYQWLKTRY
jgi:3-dehydroquinate synthase